MDNMQSFTQVAIQAEGEGEGKYVFRKGTRCLKLRKTMQWGLKERAYQVRGLRGGHRDGGVPGNVSASWGPRRVET